MKFGSSFLEELQYPGWESHYVRYRYLKQVIKSMKSESVPRGVPKCDESKGDEGEEGLCVCMLQEKVEAQIMSALGVYAGTIVCL